MMSAARADSDEAIWPIPKYSPLEHEPCFLFILAPPYSGCTALAQVLNSAPNSMFLQERGEGQRLVPGMCQNDRWEPSKRIEWSSVQATWFARISFIEKLVGPIDVVIEKSPPNLVRADQLVNSFPINRIVAFNRNPYANCASILYRRYDPENKVESDRIGILKKLASIWVFRSTWLSRWIEAFEPVFFTYEQFCSDPKAQIQKIVNVLPSLAGVDVHKPFKVKDYPIQGIHDQNERQIAKLSERERSAIGQELTPHENLLTFFNYTSNWKMDAAQGGAGNIAPQPT
jgi:hypothetical protein